MTLKKSMVAGTSLLACTLMLSPAWADPDKGYGGHGEGYGGNPVMATGMAGVAIAWAAE